MDRFAVGILCFGITGDRQAGEVPRLPRNGDRMTRRALFATVAAAFAGRKIVPITVWKGCTPGPTEVSLNALCAAIGIRSELLYGDLRNVNYSSFRAQQMAFERAVMLRFGTRLEPVPLRDEF